MIRKILPLLVCLTCVFPLFAATFTVTNGGDSGPGTLRQAILDANATPGRDTIVVTTDVTFGPDLPPHITGVVDIIGATAPAPDKWSVVNPNFFDGAYVFFFDEGAAGSSVHNLRVDGYSHMIVGAPMLVPGSSANTFHMGAHRDGPRPRGRRSAAPLIPLARAASREEQQLLARQAR
jgi:hypothetical protein